MVQRSATDQEIEAGLDYVAYLIARYGDIYWPVFDRLDRELEERRSRAARVAARLNRAARRSAAPDVKAVLRKKRKYAAKA